MYFYKEKQSYDNLESINYLIYISIFIIINMRYFKK